MSKKFPTGLKLVEDVVCYLSILSILFRGIYDLLESLELKNFWLLWIVSVLILIGYDKYLDYKGYKPFD